jgi:YidC/Oxa1 family membrane protein insertase
MDQQRRLLLFFTLSLAILIGWSQFVVPLFMPPPKPRPNVADLLDGAGPISALFPENMPIGKPLAGDAPALPPRKVHPAQQVTIGSIDPGSGYFLAVELTSRGGAVAAIELNDPRYPEFGKRGTPLRLVGHDATQANIHTFGTQLAAIDKALGPEKLETVHWELVEHDPSQAIFRFEEPTTGLRVTKRYALDAELPPAGADDREFRDVTANGYQLKLTLTIENLKAETQPVQYMLRGPVGVPLEDALNTSKHTDVRLGFLRTDGEVDHSTFHAYTVHKQWKQAFGGAEVDLAKIEVWKRPVQYIGVDTQYFAALVHPVGDQLKSPIIEAAQASMDGERKDPKFAQVSTLMASPKLELARAGDPSGGDRLVHDYILFAGPKREALLAPLKAEMVLDYGWFAPLVRLMLGIVKTLHDSGIGYGIAILLLTCLVRAALIPLTMYQYRSMDKMKELQPRVKILHEKYKNDPNSLTAEEQRAMMEVQGKMLLGCLPLFAQMPIFIALYRALQVSVDLRMAPFHLFGSWIDNLATPDALFAFGFALPWFGWTHFNILPLLSIVLMQINQKLTMPPPVDEEQELQYRMMNIMMWVMVVFFYLVPAGLCLYFIMSSVWGMSERALMKRFMVKKTGDANTAAAALSSPTPPPKPTPAAANGKPTLVDSLREKLKELQELADKQATARRNETTTAAPPNKPKKKPRR